VCREVFTWQPDLDRRGHFLAEAMEEEVHVAVVDGRIAGLASFYRPDNFLHSLYIEKDSRGQGAGLALLKHVRQAADGPVSLKVQKLNFAAIAFYRSQGMTVFGEGDLEAPGGGWFRMQDADRLLVK